MVWTLQAADRAGLTVGARRPLGEGAVVVAPPAGSLAVSGIAPLSATHRPAVGAADEVEAVVGGARDSPLSLQRFVGAGSVDDHPGPVVGEDVGILGRGLGDRGAEREGPERAVEPLRDVDGDEVGTVQRPRGSRSSSERFPTPRSHRSMRRSRAKARTAFGSRSSPLRPSAWLAGVAAGGRRQLTGLIDSMNRSRSFGIAVVCSQTICQRPSRRS